MKNKFVDCFMLMGTALSLKGDAKQRVAEMGRPLLQEVYTTTVNISLTVEEFKIDGKTMEAEIRTLLNQQWIDSRLGANAKTRKMAVTGQIWKPKITNINGKSEIPYNDDTTFWRGFGDEGNVVLSENLLLKVSCTQDLKRFPFDKQICEFKFGSYRFPKEEVLLSWNSKPAVQIAAEVVELNNFELINVSTYLEVDIRIAGNFSVAVLQILLQRHPYHYLLCIMLPCMLLTLLNYVSLWIDLKHRYTRFYINLSVFGAMLYFYHVSVCTGLHAPYLKAIDIFVIICKLFSLAVMLEALIIDRLCIAEEVDFHLKRSACSQQYPRGVYWTELAIKISYPVFYLFFLAIFSAVYIQ